MFNTSPQTSVPSQFGLISGNFLPARLDATQTAKILGFQEHDIPVLVNKSLLEPLGKPVENSRKYFALVNILERAGDASWLGKATRSLAQHWQDKNANRKSNAESSESAHSE